MKNLLLKTLALCLFLSGITFFVMHQSGYFSGNRQGYQGSHNGGAVTASDSLYQQKRDSVKWRIQSSSKSIIPDARLEERVDRVLPPKHTENDELLRSSKVYIPMKDDMFPKSDSVPGYIRRMAPSSKSAIPANFFENRTSDSVQGANGKPEGVKADTIKTFTNKKKQ